MEQRFGTDEEFLRAMARRRRRRWIIVLGIVLGVIAIVGLGVFLYDLHWERKLDAKAADLRAQGKLVSFEQMLSRHTYLDPEENSALVYLEAYEQLEEPPEAYVVETTVGALPVGTRPSQVTLGMLRSEAEANAEALGIILGARDMAEGSYPLEPADSPWAVLLEYLAPLRRSARLCTRVALLHAAEGDAEGAARHVSACMGLGASCGERSFLIECLIRTNVDAIAVDALERSLALCEFTPDDLEALKARFLREKGELSLDMALVYERSALHFTFEHTAMDPEAMHNLDGGGPFEIYAWMPSWREKDALFGHDTYDEMERIRALPPRQALLEIEQLASDIERGVDTVFPPPIISMMLMPALARSLDEEVKAKLTLSLAVTGLAAEQFRLREGRWPDSLDELVPELLDDVPEDLFGTGKVRYLSTQTGVRIYGVGEDGQDNGGVARDELPDPSAWDGYDMVFRLLDPELRGARAMTLAEEFKGSQLDIWDLEEAGFDEERLKALGLTDEDLEALR